MKSNAAVQFDRICFGTVLVVKALYTNPFKYLCGLVLGRVDLSGLFLQQFVWYLYEAEHEKHSYSI